ncbi:hypothetical protein [Roseofilum casamattae]|uniref:CcmD family protein n=1 Tax=Roseofilum casamattae BLCC-M143 TaxID=3022442 RepID=A0ABT7BWN3_9CYAN|nr:hypothetical protein [Roseofilum casamattae]MDJ1183609.1 hypothetical protein [Roseofilum casamattae BLCC-M143]
MESPLFTGLVWTAFSLLVLVTLGIVYLTLIDWNDRRRQQNEERE